MYVLLTFYVLFVHLCSVVSCFWSYVCTTDFLRSFCASVFRRFVKTFAGSLDLNLQFSACLSVSFRSGVLRVFLCWKFLYKLSARGNRGKQCLLHVCILTVQCVNFGHIGKCYTFLTASRGLVRRQVIVSPIPWPSIYWTAT